MTMGRMIITSKHTVVPRDDLYQADQKAGHVVNYQLSDEELAKYRAMPQEKEKKSVFIIPIKRKM